MSGAHPRARSADSEINIDMIVSNIAHDGLARHSFTMHMNDLGRAQVALKPVLADVGPEAAIETEAGIAKLSCVGIGMRSHSGVAARMFQALGDQGIKEDHPDVEELYARAAAIDAGISLATVYRTVKLFEEAGILEKLEFGDGRARYEDAERDHHDHLIDMNSGEVIEFVDAEIEALQERIAEKLGYTLKGHRLELYGVKRKE